MMVSRNEQAQRRPLTSTTPIPAPDAQGFQNVLVIKDDSNIECSAREVSGRFDDRAFQNLIGPDVRVISFLVENDFESRTHRRRDAQRALGYDVRTKSLECVGGKLKGNVDVEIGMTLQSIACNGGDTDLVCLLSGDGDFAPAIQAVQRSGVAVWVIAFSHSLSHHLRNQADLCIPVGQDLLLPLTHHSQSSRRAPMANLKHLRVFCNRGWNHFQPVRMRFSHFASPYTPVYRCPVCGANKVFNRKYHGGPVRRIA